MNVAVRAKNRICTKQQHITCFLIVSQSTTCRTFRGFRTPARIVANTSRYEHIIPELIALCPVHKRISNWDSWFIKQKLANRSIESHSLFLSACYHYLIRSSGCLSLFITTTRNVLREHALQLLDLNYRTLPVSVPYRFVLNTFKLLINHMLALSRLT